VFVAVALMFMVTTAGAAVRLKDVVDLRGARGNQLVGYGLVVGLAGTGDDQSAKFSSESVATMLKRLGTSISRDQLRLRNVAAVMLTADLPAFVAPGQRIDVLVSSIGTAKSLQGGTLLMAPLKGPDLLVYAVAQGPISMGGFLAAGKSGSSSQKNHPTVGRIPNGAIVERAVLVELGGAEVMVSLRSPDFTTAVAVATAIDDELSGRNAARAAAAAAAAAEPKRKGRSAKGGKDGKGASADDKAPVLAPGVNEEPFAWARDPGTVVIRVPDELSGKIPVLVARLERLHVTPDAPTRVVINERTGTIVLGQGVRLTPVAIAHGGLTVEIQEGSDVSQPGAFSQGTTAVTPRSQVNVTEAEGDLHMMGQGTSLSDVVSGLNALGVTPRDLVAILQALKTAGALHAEIEVQ